MVLPKSMRLKGHRCFDYLYKKGLRYHAASILLRVVKSQPSLQKYHFSKSQEKAFKCAVAISSKVSKKAVIRNQIRRKLHIHLTKRLSKTQYNMGYWALFSLKPQSATLNPSQVLKECDQLLIQAGLLK